MKNKWWLFNPDSANPYRISRSKIDLFLECPRCFYLDRVLDIKRPSMPGFSLNSAVDALLKNEFDSYRKNHQPHPLMIKYGIDAVPFEHVELPAWRDDICKYIGASVIHEPTNLEICGIVDDIWVGKENNLYIVDYKSTSTKKEISLDDEYKQGYKKQAELYQWIFRKKGFTVSDTCYFVFANGIKDKDMFDGQLEFEMSIISHQGIDGWVEPTLLEIKKCLESSNAHEPSKSCEYCNYFDSRESNYAAAKQRRANN